MAFSLKGSVIRRSDSFIMSPVTMVIAMWLSANDKAASGTKTVPLVDTNGTVFALDKLSTISTFCQFSIKKTEHAFIEETKWPVFMLVGVNLT